MNLPTAQSSSVEQQYIQEFCTSLLKVSTSGRLLEIGSYKGYDLPLYMNLLHNYTVIASDAFSESVAYLRETHNNPRLQIEQLDITGFILYPQDLEGIIAKQVFQHFTTDQLIQALSNCHAMLCEG